MSHLIIKECRICKSKKLNNFFDLGAQPLANNFKKNLRIEKFPLCLILCKKCKTVQLNSTISPKKLFSKYLWLTSTSLEAKKYSEVFFKKLIKINKKKKPIILEIASNDGTFLLPFKKKGYKVIGVEPAKNLARISIKNKINTENFFFNEKTAEHIKKKYNAVDIVFARNVIAHVNKIHSFLNGVNKIIKQDGIFAVEFHSAEKIQNQLQYDSIYHEHIFYFTAQTICNLFLKHKFYAFDLDFSPISGGALVIYFKKIKLQKSRKLIKFLKKEKKEKINTKINWLKFKKESINHSKKFMNILNEIAKKEKIIAYGASARSTVFLNYNRIKENYISTILDKNYLKSETFSPGSKIKIILYNNFKKLLTKQKYILLLAWNFSNEIIKELKKDKFKGKIIQAFPNTTKVYDI